MTSDIACLFMCLLLVNLSYMKKLFFNFGAFLEIIFVFWTGFLNEVFDLQKSPTLWILLTCMLFVF